MPTESEVQLQNREMRVGEAESMSEVVYSLLPSLEVTDSTEQLVVYLFLRLLVTFEQVDWRVIGTHLSKRLLASFVTHHLMSYLVTTFPPLHLP